MKAPLKTLLFAATTLMAASSGLAATYTWQTTGSTDTWNPADTNWFIDAGSTLSAWTDANAAVFDAAAGETVTLAGSLAPVSTTVNNNGNWTFAGSGSLSGNLIKNGTGELTFTNTTNTFGAITLAGGTIRFNNASSLGSSAIAVTGNAKIATNTGTPATQTIANAITIGTGATLSADSGYRSIIFSGVISGADATSNFATASSGTTYFTAANTYAGTTTVGSGAAINVGNGGVTGALGSGQINISGTGVSSGGALVFNRTDTTTVANVITGGGSVTVASGNLTLSATNTYTGGTTISGSGTTLNLGAGGGTGLIRGALTINSGATVSLSGGNDAFGYFTGLKVDSVTINGGTLTTSVNNGWGVAYTLNGGSMLTTGSGAYTFGGNSTAANTSVTTVASATTSTIGTIVLRNDNSNTNVNFTVADGAAASDLTVGAISGTGVGITKLGAGTMTISANSSYTGDTNVNAGLLDLKSAGTGASGVIRGTANVAAGATLQLSIGDATGYDTSTRLGIINLNGGTLNINTTANQTLGSAVINMTGGAITGVTGSNLDFFGGASALNTLASSTTATIGGTKLTLRQTGGATFTVAQGTTSSGIDLSVSSVVTNGGYGAQAFTKAGAGTMRLTGTNNYTGATNINAGKIITGNTAALGASTAVTVASGAALQIGDGTVNTVALASGATLAIQNGGSLRLGAINLASLDATAGTNGVITLSGAGTFTFGASGSLDLGGVLNNLSAGVHKYNLITGGTGTDAVTFTGYDASVTGLSMSGGVLTFTAVPEPSTYGLLGAGALAAVAAVRRRKAKVA